MKTKPLRILFVQNAQGIGGSENYLLRLLPALKREGHSVALAAVHNRWKEGNLDEVESWLEAFRREGVPVHFKKVFSYLDPGILFWLWRLLRQGTATEAPYDVVHIHLIYADYWAGMLKALFREPIPIVSTIHGYEERIIERFATNPEQVPRNLYWHVLQWSHQHIDATYACSVGLKRFCVQAGIRGADAWAVVEHGFDFPPPPSGEDLSACRLGAQQLAIVGRLIHRKGVHLALEALSHIKDQWPELHLVVVGRGHEAAALKSQTRQLGLEGRVTFTGFDAQPQRWMRASDAVLVPSYAEGLPLVVFEAFANGKPVLAFDTIGCADLVEHGVDGVLVQGFSTKALGDAMADFLQAPKRWNVMGAAGRQKAMQTYSLKRMVSETIQVYQKLLEL